MNVEKLNLNEQLKNFFGFDHFRGTQEQIIRHILNGQDALVVMPTGAGKSICYQLPALISEGTAVIVSPLIALMKNQVDLMENQLDSKFAARFLNSTLNKTELQQVKDDLLQKRTKMLYVAPESLVKEENINLLKNIKISFFAIDEAHCISEWGHDFRPEYRQLKQIFSNIQQAPILALTATATPRVQEDIKNTLEIPKAKTFLHSFNRSNLFYEIRPKVDVLKNILKIIKDRPGQSGVIYCMSRKTVEELAANLQVNGVKAVPYHAGLDANTRTRHQDLFLKEEVDVIVATIAFGMGIDKPDIRFVIHHDIPKSLESYYQETGRAGRDGGTGVCYAFYSYKDIEKLEAFLGFGNKPPVEQEFGKQLLVDMTSFAETSTCRRKYILHYFGEDFEDKDCQNMCDNCKNPKEKFEAQPYLEALFSVIDETNAVYHSKDLVNFMLGKLIAKIKHNDHEALEIFGQGKELSEDEQVWNAVIRQSILAGFCEKNVEKQGALYLTDLGKKFLEEPNSVIFYKENDYSHSEDMESSDKLQAIDEILFNMLKDLRKQVAKKNNLPPSIVFQEPSLVEMCNFYPTNLEQLAQISGVGTGKAKRFGAAFVELISRYVIENEIEKPQDFQIKSVHKQGFKIHLIKNIDNKLPMEDLAEHLGLTTQELLEEVEHLVEGGTKINIQYHLDFLGLDSENISEIIDFLRNEETASWEKAKIEFDDLYTEEELRWVRIKFIAEYGN